MKRRSFLGFLGGAAVAGPQAAKSAAQMTMADLGTPGIALNASGFMGGGVSPASQANWAVDALKRLTGMTALAREAKRRRHYVEGISPEVAVLRSVSLPRKIAMSRDIQFEKSLANERGYLNGVIEGWWD